MKKFLIILLASPLLLSASVAEYCMEKYSPDKEKDKFIQCVDDILEFSKNNEGLFYWPDFDFDGLGDLITLEGYQIKLYNPIC